MHIDDALIQKLSHLSMIEIDEEELPEIKSGLEKMLGFINKIQELDLDDVEPLRHLNEVTTAYREDVPGNMLSAEEVFKNATHHNHAFFLVPKVIRKS